MVRKIILDLPNEEALKLLDEDIKAFGIIDEDIYIIPTDKYENIDKFMEECC